MYSKYCSAKNKQIAKKKYTTGILPAIENGSYYKVMISCSAMAVLVFCQSTSALLEIVPLKCTDFRIPYSYKNG